MEIFIPTYGRAAQQITYDNLPAKIRQQTKLVVQERERALYPVYPIVVLPDRIRTIAATREWITFEHFPTVAKSEKLLMLDDDLKFQTRRKDDPGKFLEATDTEKLAMFAAIEKEIGHYAAVGVVPREGGNRAVDGNMECTRAMRVLGYYVPTLQKLKCSFLRGGPKFTLEDFDMLLQLLRAGKKNLVLTAWCQGQGSSNTEGGCASYRTLELHNKNAARLATLHPEFVKLVQKTTSTAWGGATRTDVTVQWKKAYLSSGGVL